MQSYAMLGISIFMRAHSLMSAQVRLRKVEYLLKYPWEISAVSLWCCAILWREVSLKICCSQYQSRWNLFSLDLVLPLASCPDGPVSKAGALDLRLGFRRI